MILSPDTADLTHFVKVYLENVALYLSCHKCVEKAAFKSFFFVFKQRVLFIHSFIQYLEMCNLIQATTHIQEVLMLLSCLKRGLTNSPQC